MSNIKKLLAVLVIIMLFLLYTLWNFLGSESYACLSSPMVYGVNRVGDNVDCVCINDRIMQKDKFGINNTEVWNIMEDNSNLPIIIP